MMDKDEIFKLMNKEELLKFYRSAGGHDEHMKNLIKGAKVIGHYNSEEVKKFLLQEEFDSYSWNESSKGLLKAIEEGKIE